MPVGGKLRDHELAALTTLESFDAEHRPMVDLCVIATDTGRHVSDAIRFQSSCQRLLIEKPLAPSLAAAAALHTVGPGKAMAVSAPLRFAEGFATLRESLAHLGVVTGVAVECRSWLPDWRPGRDHRHSYSASTSEGGVLLDLIHEIDYCLHLFGPPSTLGASVRTHAFLGIESESSGTLLWRYANFDLEMHLDYVSRPASRQITVYGTKASTCWNVLTGVVSTRIHESGDVTEISHPGDLDRDELLTRQMDALLTHDGDMRLATLEEGRDAVRVVDVARESAAFGSLLIPLDAS